MFSAFFIKRPVFSAVASIIIVLAGLAAMINLPVQQYPRVIPPQIIVNAAYPGAGAQTLSETVAAPLEESINGVNDMIYMNSVAEDSGQVSINVFFEVGKDPDAAKIDVNNRVQAALSNLPQAVQRQGVTVRERSPSVLQFITLYSPDDQRDLKYLANYALLNIAEDLKRIPGVGGATVFGGKEYAMRVWIDPQKLAKHDLSTNEVIGAIEEQNRQYAAGKFAAQPLEDKKMFTYTIETQKRLDKPEEFGQIMLKTNEDGSSLRLNDVATIELGAQNYSVATELNNNPAIPIGVFLQSGANALQTAKAVNKTLEEAATNFPEGVGYEVPYDSTEFVDISIKEVAKTFIEAIILVIAIIYLFLQNWRATLIPVLAVPVSIIGAFAGMYALGFSINLLTLFGLVLSIGIVVDDAIIVIENVQRHLQEGMKPKEAAFTAMKEVQSALIAIVLVLSAVFIPVAFMGGLSGEMYKQFAVTIVISLIISGFVALTLTPALCATMLKPETKKPGGFFKLFNAFFEKATKGYSKAVQLSIRYGFISMLLFGGLIYVSYDMFTSLKTGLVPKEDKGTIFMFSFNPPSSSLDRTQQLTDEINAILNKNDNVDNIITLNGLDFTTGFTQRSHTAATVIKLKDWDQRPGYQNSAQYLADQFSKQAMGGTSEGVSFAVLPPPIMGMSVSGGFEMYVQNRSGEDIKMLNKHVQSILQKARENEILTGMRTSLSINVPKYSVTVDTAKAKAKGVDISNIYQTLNATLGSYYVNDFNLYGRTYQVNVQAKGQYRESPESLKEIFVKNGNGQMIPVSSLVDVEQIVGTDLAERFNLFEAAKISGQPAAGYSSGEALDAIENIANEVLPQGYTVSWIGTAYQQKQVSSNSTMAFIFGIVLLFLILAAQYGRWMMPISVIMAVPFSIFGAVVATNLRGLDNDIYFQVGLLVLAGLAAKNAILIVEFAQQKRSQGIALKEAAVEAAKIRLRPIIMTSLAFTLGVIPLAISSGAGAASRHSIGTGVIGGMLGATFIAIIFVPLFYILVSKLSRDKE
ncbi:MAG: efflux RND transporter permease subunit [Campylobacterota bacterium]